jgi:peptidoglycan/LPS O-acetylase OafA/YrhL
MSVLKTTDDKTPAQAPATEELCLKAGEPSQSERRAESGAVSYLPFLDGLRAISILLVLGFHQLGPLSGWLGTQFNGWVGVDLFFLISGFLISSILLKEQERRGKFSLKNFYIRRWLRICPAYYAFLAFMLVFTIVRGQHDFASFAIAGLYLTNVDMCFGWGLCTPLSGLMHTWSLSVEEQFYLLWPATLKACGKKAMAVCSALIGAAYLWRVYLATVAGAGWIRLSSGLDTKLDSIMLGVAVALLWRNEKFRQAAEQIFAAPLMQLTVACTLLAACHCLGHPATETNTVLFWAVKLPLVLVLMATLLVSLLANQESRTARILSSKPMIWIGRLSYSLYLWHVIVNFPCTDALLQTICHHKRYIVEIAKLSTCFGFAAASYYLIEMPFLKLKSRYS